uniref:Gag-Pol polyprotein n=1 Tax=Tanacetum cinerariifolium TaxID=118510 RepID=A0A6L2K397_TANCI|nr:hypothetical protein [Tanacetum cinerariifolium]
MSETSVANDTSGLVPQQQKAIDYDNSDPVSQIQNVLPLVDTTVPSQQELDLLFGPLYDEFFNADHPLEQVRANPSKPVQTRRQLATNPEMCMFALTVSTTEPKNIKEAMADFAWIEAMQEELHQFDILQVWVLVDKPFGMTVMRLKWLWKNKMDEDHTAKYTLETLKKHGMEKGQSIGPISYLVSAFVHASKRIPKALILERLSVSSDTLKKQTALAISTTEAEYVSIEKACQQALWMKQGLIYYNIRLDDDNVQKGHISIEKVSSIDNRADILTKPLKRESFNYLRLGLGMMEHIADNKSFTDEDIPKEIYLNPLFYEEITSIKIDPHHFNAESDLIESLLNQDSSIISSSKIDSLLDEFASELILLKSIPSGINEADCDPEEEICLIEKLLYDNSSLRPLEEFISKNFDVAIESFSPSPIHVEDSDSLRDEIDLSLTPNDLMPPGIKDDDYDSKGIYLKNCLAMIPFHFLKMIHFILIFHHPLALLRNHQMMMKLSPTREF